MKLRRITKNWRVKCMEMNDVIKEVATLLGLSNVMGANLDADNFDTQTQKDLNLLISSTNEVLCDIATDYLPLKAEESVTVSGNSFDLTTLSHTFHKLTRVNTKEPYKVLRETLFIKDGTYDLEYTYLPEIYELGDEIEDIDPRLTLFALSYGVSAEYCLISGNYSESELWLSRFEDAMRVATRSAKIPTLKERRWI